MSTDVLSLAAHRIPPHPPDPPSPFPPPPRQAPTWGGGGGVRKGAGGASPAPCLLRQPPLPRQTFVGRGIEQQPGEGAGGGGGEVTPRAGKNATTPLGGG